MLTELLQGLKNIGDVINEDTEMKQCFYLKVNKPSDQFQDPGFDKIIQQEDLDRMVET